MYSLFKLDKVIFELEFKLEHKPHLVHDDIYVYNGCYYVEFRFNSFYEINGLIEYNKLHGINSERLIYFNRELKLNKLLNEM
jgi:hypothetical protein